MHIQTKSTNDKTQNNPKHHTQHNPTQHNTINNTKQNTETEQILVTISVEEVK